MKHLTPYFLFEASTLDEIYYHGTNSSLPFERFERNMDGTGLVSANRKAYGGFFFTSERDNALFYSEDLLCRVRIRNVVSASEEDTHSPTVLKKAIEDGINIRLLDVLDGSHFSNVVVVPYQNLDDIEIIGWEFVGDEEYYFETLDNIFKMGDDESDIDQYSIEDFFEITGGGLDLALNIPVFRKYYDSKR